MKKCWVDVLAGALVAMIALAVWLPQIGWGLPSREADRWLFGRRTAWSGQEILEKLGEVGAQATRGADVDATPIVDRSKAVLLNDSDAKRASIVQRFRLMSGQPDEFIQFKALAEMAGRSGFSKYDPRLYQYGGLWIYPVGGLVRGAMAAGWIETPPAGVAAREFYLDRPDAFGKFYIVGRAYSMAWGIVAAIAVYVLAKQSCSRDATPSLVLEASSEEGRPATALRRGYLVERVLALIAAVAFILLPSVQTSAHEAKPHLAGAALCLLATLAASRFIQTGKRRWLLTAGALCGAAMGMVVSMVLSVIVLPAAVIARARRHTNPRPRIRGRGQGEGASAIGARVVSESQATTPSPQPSPPITGARELSVMRSLVVAIGIAFLVYAITNPFVLFNAIAAPHLLQSNLGNSTAMYGVRGPLAMIPDAWRIAGHAMTPYGARLALAVVVALGVMAVLRRVQLVAPSSRTARGSGATSCTLQAVAILIAIQFVLLAAGRPAEYARFGLVLWAALCVAGAIAIRNIIASSARCGSILLIAIGASFFLPPVGLGRHGYDAWQWAYGDESAAQLDAIRTIGSADGERWQLGVAYEPAPWSTPPVNLFDQDILLVRATPAMLEEVDAFVWPVNLESQCFEAEHDRESLDWRQNRFGHRAEARDGDEERWRGGW